jgi:SAM-dependent methyltransferase
VLRVVDETASAELAHFLSSRLAQTLLKEGALVATEPVSPNAVRDCPAGATVYEHERIPFVAYPYEWPSEMLHAAGQLTLDIAERSVQDGFGLKDASPYNILFRGPNPVFVDVLSFERRKPDDSTWLPYAQFTRNFSLPLLASKHLGMSPVSVFRTRRDGIRPREIYTWMGPFMRFRPGILSSVTVPVWLSRFESERLYSPRSMPESQARYVLKSLFRRLRKNLAKVEPRDCESQWSEYGNAPPSYTEQQLSTKRRFVQRALDRLRPSDVLDVGCNTGTFSLLAADQGASVVAIDADPVVVGRLWREARSRKVNILPLVVDIAWPSPALGWNNRENASFLDRARGSFDVVLMLALIHHLLVSERVPLEQIVSAAAELTRAHAIIEYVGPADPMFHRLARGRDHLHAGLDPAAFENVCRKHFEIVESEQLPACDRILYLLRRRNAA